LLEPLPEICTLRRGFKTVPAAAKSSFGRGILDGHVLEFAALEHLAAFQALNEFGILFASNYLHAGVAALLVRGTAY
jgi:hypothetical protein